MSLSNLALVNIVTNLRAASFRRPVLHTAVDAARAEAQKNEDFIRDCKAKLADHTKELHRPEIVAIDDEIAALIPIPDGGCTCVEPIFSRLTKL